MESLLDKLNPVQREAVLHQKGPLLIIAGAGSGKTRTLTHRIAYMMTQGISPYNILAITFTNKAAKEMKERLVSMSEQGGQVWAATFHSTCVRILRRDIHRLGYDSNFVIYDAADSERMVKLCIRELNLNDKQYPHKSVLYFISQQKDELITPDEAERLVNDFRSKKYAEVYRLYQKKLKENNALDFDDIIFRTVELFSYFPDVLERYQERFKYLMVDEYQDTNTAQYRFVMLLAEKYRNLCVVGDDDQSIYSWRGANIRNILDFEKDFTDAKVIKLEQNYRSTQNILDAANRIICNNCKRKEKILWTDNEAGERIRFNVSDNEAAEGNFISSEIREQVKNGSSYSRFAILYRTNAQSRPLEEQLVLSGIPYRVFGGIRFYERKEIKDLLAYLRVINNPQDGLALTRIINVPRRGIGDASVQKINEYAGDNDISFFMALEQLDQITSLKTRLKAIAGFRDLIKNLIAYAKDHTVTEVINETLSVTEFTMEYVLENTEEAKGRLENIEAFINKATEFESTSQDKSLSAFLEEVALVADIDEYHEDQETVSLMTLHSSKGLEFPRVFITGFEEGVFPSIRSILDGGEGELEEERRLCYVGFTRAQEKLYITAARSRNRFGQTVYNTISRFYMEIPSNLIETKGLERRNRKKMETHDNRTGVSKYAEINKVRNSVDLTGAKNYIQPKMPEPKNVLLDYQIGDKVRQLKYGTGVVKDIQPAGADYEVTIEFPAHGVKKLFARLSKLKKVE